MFRHKEFPNELRSAFAGLPAENQAVQTRIWVPQFIAKAEPLHLLYWKKHQTTLSIVIIHYHSINS